MALGVIDVTTLPVEGKPLYHTTGAGAMVLRSMVVPLHIGGTCGSVRVGRGVTVSTTEAESEQAPSVYSTQ